MLPMFSAVRLQQVAVVHQPMLRLPMLLADCRKSMFRLKDSAASTVAAASDGWWCSRH